jgi:hypothetical protein
MSAALQAQKTEALTEPNWSELTAILNDAEAWLKTAQGVESYMGNPGEAIATIRDCRQALLQSHFADPNASEEVLPF